MNLRDLQYLVTLYEEKNFNLAAKKCFVTQPGLSIQIKKLEDQLGVKLLERGTKSILFTEIGLAIVQHAKKILHEIQELKLKAKSAHDPFSGKVNLGIIPTLSAYALPLMMPLFRKFLPKVSVYITEEKTDILMHKLDNGELDAAFLALPINMQGLISVQLFEEECFLAAPAEHEISQLKIISEQDLSEQELLLLEEGHCLREQALQVCEKFHTAENQYFRATSLETLKNMIAAGLGLTVVPKLACTPLENVVYLPFSQPKPYRTIGLVFRITNARQVLCEHIAAVIQKHLKV